MRKRGFLVSPRVLQLFIYIIFFVSFILFSVFGIYEYYVNTWYLFANKLTTSKQINNEQTNLIVNNVVKNLYLM